MHMTGNIFLVGLMGAGKTTIGKLLAKAMGKTFYDSDQEIEQRTGVNIPLIFELEGESGFRKREAAVIADLTGLHEVVLATGGGAVLLKQNRENLSQNGTVVYLRADVAELWHRTRNDKNRPLLQTEDPRAKLEQLFAERDPLYLEIADIIIDTGRHSVSAILHQLESQLELHANAHR
jgi:shikimate kinase